MGLRKPEHLEIVRAAMRAKWGTIGNARQAIGAVVNAQVLKAVWGKVDKEADVHESIIPDGHDPADGWNKLLEALRAHDIEGLPDEQV